MERVETKKQAMSVKGQEYMIWANDKSWYRADEGHNRLELTDEAPPAARASFEKYKRLNHLDWDD